MVEKTKFVKELAIKQLKELLTHELSKQFQKKDLSKSLQTQRKKDGTLVTHIDQLVHDFLQHQKENSSIFKSYGFLSEEQLDDSKPTGYPCVVLDPIDGTKELAKGVAECCVSLAILQSPEIKESLSKAWLYNPFTGFELISSSQMVEGHAAKVTEEKLLGFVSRTEYEAQLYEKEILTNQMIFAPKGSIAFKLGLLALGACDFVVTKRPKNLWDIAAGTVLCKQRKINIYGKNSELLNWKDIEDQEFLLWCRPEYANRLSSAFQ